MTYLDRLRALKSEKGPPPHTDKTDKTSTGVGYVSFDGARGTPFSEISSPLRRTLSALESACPELVPEDRWRRCVEDGRRFLAAWADQAEALGWTAQGSVRVDAGAAATPTQLQPPVSIRRDRTDLAAAGPAGRRADRGDRRDPDLQPAPSRSTGGTIGRRSDRSAILSTTSRQQGAGHEATRAQRINARELVCNFHLASVV